MSDFIYIEDRTVYDGWCCKFYFDERRFEWRDHWAVNKLSEHKKSEIERQFLRGLDE